MLNDVILNKTQIIKRCLKRINEEYQNNPHNLENFTKQDSIILNLQRACEACIDLAMHIVAENNLGLPQTSRQAFDMLYENGFIERNMAERLKAMVGFRNISVHDYQAINLGVLQNILDKHLEDFNQFLKDISNKCKG
ncbi:type VII toxin-antitoxin system HepT family RNase toxin [Desulforamulus ferrireducens]|uniref:DUF86 domain-containing protein n=1 Tax=Desulforamulus ferrireducens TaxID=1833852 RepID=A0A1S6IYK2_9FIRM|nr:DUF86 domain-containing protein [Desulforamulus ferrireducens]AQS59830.1 hypothetical protein B0537_12505 [Desulforamulus ferrireducens]